MGPPLRPSPEDIAVMRREVRARERGGHGARVLVMGVTPELAGLGSHTLAVDRNPSMIRGVWPDFGRKPGSYVCADWGQLPVADGSRDLVLCDGGLTLARFPDGYRAWAREVSRVLSTGGRAVVRAFVLPEEPETAEAVLEDLEGGAIRSFHAFRWRLAMALQRDVEEGVGVDEVWRFWDREGRLALARATSPAWPDEVVHTIEAYRDLTLRLRFPTLGAVRSVLQELFEERQCYVPRYELGARCPTLVLSPRPS